ncbi:DASS family sodium-coupled anion symporter [Geodermatophilus sp. DSM 44513]|uniref:SLC13 family permease n=1 Tax=Geodermatophilus sp. DSM 44513 TaxID=1528104 RepID=UPI00127BE315|nr:DASS family sodium-coupled anion symporter [Geodermatophilus sp. DSM 44513]WNV76422.1 DASS family sodium-coupled anion symporter [Geodermatophilus sp. DSM 44513]
MSERPTVPGPAESTPAPDPRRGGTDHRSPGEQAPADSPRTHRIRWAGFAGGLVLALLVYLVMPQDLAHGARLTAATAVLMGVWWMTETIPIPATALLPLVVFPVLGDAPIEDVGAQYGNDIIFLFLGGFFLALAMQRWDLHRRIALRTVGVMGTRPVRMVAGFMLATGFLSMWVSNTATAVMMLPIGVSVLLLATTMGEDAPRTGGGPAGGPVQDVDPESAEAKDAVIKSDFGTCLMLGIAYAASIGSLATLIGTPPNALLAGYLEEAHGITIGFGQWMLVGVPVATVMMVAAWFLLTKVLFKPEIAELPGGRRLIRDQLDALGPMSAGEKRVLAVFVLTAASWVFLPALVETPPISDAGIALLAGLLLFTLPSGAGRGVRLLDWDSAVKLPWGVLLLFGGGLALSSQFSDSGLTDWIGTQVEALGTVPVLVLVAAVAGGVIFLTELTSNTATAATFLPVAGGVALGLGLSPLLLAIPVALAATCAFMLPVATPPNAIAFGSGYVTIPQMVRGGLWLNLLGIVLITSATMTLAVWVFGIAY